MLRKATILVCVSVLICSGCSHRSASRVSGLAEERDKTTAYYSPRVSSGAGGTGTNGRLRIRSMALEANPSTLGGTVFAASRYIAVSHKLQIIEPGANLAKSLEAVVNFCGSIQCEVLSSNISGTTDDSIPAGSVSMRVLPQDLGKLLDFAAKQGKISQHSTETEDKTSAVIDVEAKIKNQTEFRDSLRKMLTKPGVTVADLLQIQEKLAEAQAELDSEATQRKVLANETEKVAVEIEFQSEVRSVSHSMFAPIGHAFRDSGGVLADSLAALITAIAEIIPWLIVIIPGFWVVLRFVRKLRRKRAARKAASLTNSPGQ
jgi:hypothetical protein